MQSKKNKLAIFETNKQTNKLLDYCAGDNCKNDGTYGNKKIFFNFSHALKIGLKSDADL